MTNSINTAADYMEEMAKKANLTLARKKVKGLTWGVSRIYYPFNNYSCVQGIAALASCATVEELSYFDYDLPPGVLERFGWDRAAFATVYTGCPYDNCLTYGNGQLLPANASDAVAHVNDRHAIDSPNPLKQTKRLLIRWAKQERQA